MQRILLRMLLACIGAAPLAAWAAELVLFEHDNFSGRRFAVEGAVPSLAETGFNDRASSLRIRSGTWQICSDAWYRGRCVTLSQGEYPSLSVMGLNDRVSSVREFGGWPPEGGGGGGGGGMQVVLYEQENFGGRSFVASSNIRSLGDTGFNDRARSAVVSQGQWEICGDADFGGGCQVFGPGRYPNLGPLNGRVSSLRVLGGPGGPGGPGGGGWGHRTRVVLYEGPNLSGRPFVITTDEVRSLGDMGFNDRASSLRVERGYWLFCTDADFRGTCRTFGPGDYASLPPGMNNAISSGRKINDEYPYNQAPNWGRPN